MAGPFTSKMREKITCTTIKPKTVGSLDLTLEIPMRGSETNSTMLTEQTVVLLPPAPHLQVIQIQTRMFPLLPIRTIPSEVQVSDPESILKPMHSVKIRHIYQIEYLPKSIGGV